MAIIELGLRFKRMSLAGSAIEKEGRSECGSAKLRRPIDASVRAVSVGMSLFLVILFITTLLFLIANALQNIELQSVGKDFLEKQTAVKEDFLKYQGLLLAASQAKTSLDGAKEDQLQALKRIFDNANLEVESAKAITLTDRDAFAAVICESISVLGNSWWPIYIFMKQEDSTCGPEETSESKKLFSDGSTHRESAEQSDPFPPLPVISDKLYALQKHIEFHSYLQNTFVLPIIFGLLGSVLFALWQILQHPNKIEDIRETSEYYLRSCLGAICGMLIGYLNIGTQNSSISGISVSPLLFSLVAGFSTGTVISILERISNSLSYDNTMKSPSRERAADSDLSPGDSRQ